MSDINELQLRALMQALPFPSWFKDEQGNFILGGEVMGDEASKESLKAENEVFRTGKAQESLHSRGNIHIKSVHFPVYDAKQKIIGTGGFREDINELSDSLQSLNCKCETLEALLESMPFCIFFTDKHYRYIRVNGLMAKLLRVEKPEQAVGLTNKEFFSRRVARKMSEEDRTIMKTGKPILNKIVYFEDDEVEGFWLEKNKIPIRDERGNITMVMGLFKDVSDLMRIENELKEARERARESDRLKTSFLANMSHEIRTPMNGILGFTNLLMDPDLGEEKRDLYLKHIDQSSQQLLNIIDDIIDISKIESEQVKISNKPVKINGILDEIYSSYVHRIRGDAPGQKKVAFNLKKGNDSHDFTIVTDDFRLSQVFNKLIGNAIKFTREGQIQFGYTLKQNRYIEFFVSDTGIGIPHNKIKLIFDRFGQVNQERALQPSGTGLGLPISKSLVNLMGGEMWVESEKGKGTAFYFTLPLVVEDSGEDSTVLISNKSYK